MVFLIYKITGMGALSEWVMRMGWFSGTLMEGQHTDRLSSSAGTICLRHRYAMRRPVNKKGSKARIMNTGIQFFFEDGMKWADRHGRDRGFICYKITGIAVFFVRGYYAFIAKSVIKLNEQDITK